MLVVGLASQAALRKLVYPWLRWRYEAGKARGDSGVEPNVVMGVLQLINLVLLPASGFLFGAEVLSAILQ
jgi:hypothetical protein